MAGAVLLVAAGLVVEDRVNGIWTGILAALFCLAAFTAIRIPRKYVRRGNVVERLVFPTPIAGRSEFTATG